MSTKTEPNSLPEFRRRLSSIGASVAVLAAVLTLSAYGGSLSAAPSGGLPHTSDYHSLLVTPASPAKLVLGTHQGLYVSSDGGRHWRFDNLAGNDAMNLV